MSPDYQVMNNFYDIFKRSDQFPNPLQYFRELFLLVDILIKTNCNRSDLPKTKIELTKSYSPHTLPNQYLPSLESAIFFLYNYTLIDSIQ